MRAGRGRAPRQRGDAARSPRAGAASRDRAGPSGHQRAPFAAATQAADGLSVLTGDGPVEGGADVDDSAVAGSVLGDGPEGSSGAAQSPTRTSMIATEIRPRAPAAPSHVRGRFGGPPGSCRSSLLTSSSTDRWLKPRPHIPLSPRTTLRVDHMVGITPYGLKGPMAPSHEAQADCRYPSSKRTSMTGEPAANAST